MSRKTYFDTLPRELNIELGRYRQCMTNIFKFGPFVTVLELDLEGCTTPINIPFTSLSKGYIARFLRGEIDSIVIFGDIGGSTMYLTRTGNTLKINLTLLNVMLPIVENIPYCDSIKSALQRIHDMI